MLKILCFRSHGLLGNSLAVQWLGLSAFTAVGSIPGWGAKILQAAKKKNKKQGRKKEAMGFLH